MSGGTLAMRRRFSARGFLGRRTEVPRHLLQLCGQGPRVRAGHARRPDDRHNDLRIAIGNEANEHDIDAFGRRFDV